MSRHSQVATLLMLGFVSAVLADGIAHAADGTIELNQACATTTGCTAGDAPGYPITLSASGSYALTSNLAVPANTNGVQLPNHASLDLRGFEIAGPVVCPLGSCSGGTAGNGVLGGVQNTVVDGRVRGFGLDCVALQLRGRVERLQISDCRQHGISAGAGSFVGGNQIGDVGRSGIVFTPAIVGNVPSLYRDNTIAIAGDISVDGGRASGPNACFDQSCGTTGRKFFYLTETTANGNAADAHCDTGFHMASLWEILDPAELEYDVVRGGPARADQSEGPEPGTGWIRTGGTASFGGLLVPGFNNCEG